MKNFYLSILTLAVGLSASGQTLSQGNHAPSNGDLYGMKQCDSLNINPGGSGANTVWNFSTLNIHASVVHNYTTVASNTAGYPVGGQATGSSLSDLVYTKSSASDLKYFGGNFNVQAYSGTFTYSIGAIYAAYPMSLNTTSNCAIAGSLIVVNPPLTGTFTGNSNVIADGTGTLILPGGVAGTYTNVIRVVSTQTLNYNANGIITGDIILKSVSFYSVGIKAPLLTIATKTITTSFPPSTNTESVVMIYKDYLAPTNTVDVSIGEKLKENIEISIYPNPSSSSINFKSENKSQKDLVIYDLTGKMIEKQNFNNGKLKLDISGYSDGFYQYSILNNIGEIFKTGKLIVSH